MLLLPRLSSPRCCRRCPRPTRNAHALPCALCSFRPARRWERKRREARPPALWWCDGVCVVVSRRMPFPHTRKARQRPAFSECEAAWVWAGQAEQGHRLTRTTTTAVNARCQPLLEAPAACGAPIDRFDGRHRQRHKHTRGTAGGEAALSSNNDDDLADFAQ